MRTKNEPAWYSPQREKALREWWDLVKACSVWRTELGNANWEQLSPSDKADLWEIFEADVHFMDT